MNSSYSARPVSDLPLSSRPGCGQWLAIGLLAAWLAGVPLVMAGAVAGLTGSPPAALVQLGLVQAGTAVMPVWAAGLIAILLTLALHLVVFVPVYLLTRDIRGAFLHTWTGLAIAVAVYGTLDAVARLILPDDGLGRATRPALTGLIRLALTLPYVLLMLGWLEARRTGVSLFEAWRAMGLRLWRSGSALWLALGVAAFAVWPWVLTGSLGSGSTTALNGLQVLPNALVQESLFRGIALTWLWRALAGQVPRRWMAAAGSLLLFVAAQGGTALPDGNVGALGGFGAALLLGILFTELTVRAGGSIWPAVIAHFIYDWFRVAFVDPRSEAEILLGGALTWSTIAMGLAGLILWLGRAATGRRQAEAPEGAGRAGTVSALVLAVVSWAVVGALYVLAGAPGFHPDGFLITMKEQADLSQAVAIANPAERRSWVVRTLIETANRSQAPLRAELDRRHVRYRAHYLVNAIEVLDRTSLRGAIGRRPDVGSVLFQPGVRPYPKEALLPSADASGATGVQWNISEVGADQVWAKGYTGQGVVVGSADTGVTWNHPAIEAAYLGWDGTTADHNYHWYDPWDGRTEPFDDSGHGTHTTGTMVGQSGENKIGVAPGARWIACRNMRHGIGNPGAYMSCMEFLLAPFPLGGDAFQGDPARGAQVVNNSWGCPKKEGCLPDTLRLAVDHLRAAGQMMVVSAGNDGPACSTITDPPSLFDSSFSVGAIDSQGRPASFTSRGPVTVDGSGREKPDISAPGVNVRSAMPGGYGVESGTSMAGPHVAGVVALLWSAQPSLVGNIDETIRILEQSAKHLSVESSACSTRGSLSLAGGACPCGTDQSGSVPNNVFGWGQVDAAAAVTAAGK